MSAPELRQRLAAFLLATGRIRAADLAADAPLITSGLINSVALFSLAVWIEEAIGRPVEITTVALPAEWDTMDAILAFIERERNRAA